MYKIGHLKGDKYRHHAEILQEKLNSSETQETILISHDYSTESDIAEIAIRTLLEKSNDIFCLDLSSIGKVLPPEVLIAGLSERTLQFDKLIYKTTPESSEPHIKLGSNASVVTYDERSHSLATNLFPGWQVNMKDEKPTSIKNELTEFDGLIIGNNYLIEQGEDVSSFSVFQFHPKEFIPGAGQNVTAYLIRSEDKDLRKSINKIHISEVSQATNIERAIEQDLLNKGWDSIGVYCILDSNSHYHVHVCGKDKEETGLKKCRYSSGTSENIVNNVFELLSKND